MALSCSNSFAFQQFCSEHVAGLFHEGVVVAAAFEDAGFAAAGAMADSAGGDLRE